MSLSVLLTAVLLTVAVAAVASQSLLLIRQVSMLREMLSERDLEIRRLTSLICSKDPMTYATIQATTVSTLPSEPYISTGTDEAEAKHWAKLMNEPVDDEDYTQDLEEMGLR